MADTRRETQNPESTGAMSRERPATREKSDVAGTARTEHELQPSERSLGRGGLARRGDFDLFRDPFSMINAFHREMDRLFEDFGFGSSLLRMPRLMSDLDRGFGEPERNVWAPQVEVFQREGKLHVSADLPGLKKDDVKVEVLDNNLTIEGERRSEQRDERGRWSERSYGRFFRSIPLPEGIDPGTAKASFQDGVLDITFEAPKLEERRGRQIQIGEGTSKK